MQTGSTEGKDESLEVMRSKRSSDWKINSVRFWFDSAPGLSHERNGCCYVAVLL